MGKRVYRTIEEKRRIVELTLLPGASVARVGQAEGVNANQLFRWRRAYLEGKLEANRGQPVALLPVVVSPAEAGSIPAIIAEQSFVKPVAAMPGGVLHIELSGRVKIRVESGVDAGLLRVALTTLASTDRLQGNPDESLRS